MTDRQTISKALFWKVFFSVVFRYKFKKTVRMIKAHIVFCWNLSKAEVKRRYYLDIYTK